MERGTGCIEDCLQNEPPLCTAACPFHLDVRDFIEKLQRGAFQAAYRNYANAVGFPGIVSVICPEPCRNVCPRKDIGGSIRMRALERAAVAFARSTEPNSYNVPRKPGRIAVIGAGPAGLACALRLAEKNYPVTVFEKSGRIGGHLHDLMSSEALLADIDRRFMYAEYELRLNTEIKDLAELDADAVFIATGEGGNDFGLSLSEEGAFTSARRGVFLGGSLVGAEAMGAMAQGLRACGAIEHFLKSGEVKPPEKAFETRLKMETERFVSVPAVIPAGEMFTKDEAVAEAARCLRCACDACYRACDLMHYFKKFPKRIAEEVHLSVYPGTLDGNGTLATRLISTCNQCGLCKVVCPEDIDTGGLFLQGHRAMRERGAMPWAFHDYFLRDMASANGEAGLSRRPPGGDKSRYMFFPGCQLGASDPRYVEESYRFLLAAWPDTAFQLGCCGAPAEWAGDETIRDEVTGKIRKEWEAFGRPIAVFACPTCKQMFGRHLPEIEGVFLYDLMLERGLKPPADAGGTTAAVFDPCASRDEPGVQGTIRELARRAGFRLEPLPMEGRLAQCCSWGGQVSVAHPPYARQMVKDRIAESARPYIAYCINCRDIFAAAGKPVWHILDILFGLNGADRIPPTISERRRNRIRLKCRMLERFWKDRCDQEVTPMNLVIAPELRQKMSAELILESDIAAVIDACEKTGRKVFDPAAGTCTGYLKIGEMTYWAEYRVRLEGGFDLIKAYSHRMSIEEK